MFGFQNLPFGLCFSKNWWAGLSELWSNLSRTEKNGKLLIFAYKGGFALTRFFLFTQTSSYSAHNSPLALMGLKWANLLGSPGSSVWLDHLFALLWYDGISDSLWQGLFLNECTTGQLHPWWQGMSWPLMSYFDQRRRGKHVAIEIRISWTVMSLLLSLSPLHVHVFICIYSYLFFSLLLKQIWCSYSSVAMVTQSDSCYFVLLGGLCDNDGHFPKGNGLIAKINRKVNEQVAGKWRREIHPH